MIYLLQQGGALLYVLLFLSFITTWITLQQSFIIWRLRLQNVQVNLFQTIVNQAYTKEICYMKIKEEIQRQSRLQSFALALQQEGKSDSFEEILGLQLEESLSIHDTSMSILRFIMRIAPQVGLLGTVLGMSFSFYKIASIQEAVTPYLISGGIWKALLTTIAGLIVSLATALCLFTLEYFIDKQRKQMTKLANEFVFLYKKKYA